MNDSTRQSSECLRVHLCMMQTVQIQCNVQSMRIAQHIYTFIAEEFASKDVQHGASYCLDLTSHCNKLVFKENNAIHAYSMKDHLKDLQDPKILRVAERPTRSRRRALQRHVLKEQTLRGLT